MNFGGGSKSMDADEIMKMVEDSFRHRCFIIDVIIIGENSKL